MHIENNELDLTELLVDLSMQYAALGPNEQRENQQCHLSPELRWQIHHYRLHRIHVQLVALSYWKRRVGNCQITAYAARAIQIQNAFFAARHLLEDYSDNSGYTTPDPDSYEFDS